MVHKNEAFSTRVNGCVQCCQVGGVLEIIGFTFCRKCHVFLLKIFGIPVQCNMYYLSLPLVSKMKIYNDN